jgi:hypothetical protein
MVLQEVVSYNMCYNGCCENRGYENGKVLGDSYKSLNRLGDHLRRDIAQKREIIIPHKFKAEVI